MFGWDLARFAQCFLLNDENSGGITQVMTCIVKVYMSHLPRQESHSRSAGMLPRVPGRHEGFGGLVGHMPH